jgi:hypothetical protein
MSTTRKYYPHLSDDLIKIFDDYADSLETSEIGSHEVARGSKGFLYTAAYGDANQTDWLAHAANHTRGISHE